ncbi:hypothetical protein SFLOR_v1c10560 [Spiroplasma floricola 23-6]|uniref:Uncharacterized protein n=2 Tax=Spiroplasma floricola TaxID=216937 RepID=A0A2K8SF91_9MOLU|nr:hypothetical protein SFLOR_v1c10560 [Spiroplasma floricola 23-6]
MIIILIFFAFSILLTIRSFSITDSVTNDINWWNNYKVYKYLNMHNVSLFMYVFILLVNIFLIYNVSYIGICLFIFFILDVVSNSNKEFINKIYKNSIKLKNLIKALFGDIQIKNSQETSKDKSWDSTIRQICTYESEELKINKKGKTPPSLKF